MRIFSSYEQWSVLAGDVIMNVMLSVKMTTSRTDSENRGDASDDVDGDENSIPMLGAPCII